MKGTFDANCCPVESEGILLVEDNPVNRKLAVTLLNKLGYLVKTACNGEEAIDILRRRRFDLILMDIKMPGMDGLEATRIIRDPKSGVLDHSLPIIAMTAHALPQDRARCLKAGMNDYLAKPFRLEMLTSILSQWLPDPFPCDSLMQRPKQEQPRRVHEPASFDPEALTARLLDDEQLAREILITFIGDFPSQISKLHGFVENRNLSGVSAQLHSMKGVCAGMSGMALFELTADMEEAADCGNLDELQKRLPELEVRFQQLCADAGQWLEQVFVND
jgi:CheY-like chemotaxis protein/HPt (histidine-containing phosphotransfer) domain-containing protein